MKATASMGVNSMQLQIQSLFRETVHQLDLEVARHMQYLADVVPTVKQQISSRDASSSFAGIVCPPSEDRARRKRAEVPATPSAAHSLFTPYSSSQSVSRVAQPQMFSLPDVTPVSRRKKKQASASADEVSDRSSIASNSRKGPRKDERGDGPITVRRSMRLNGQDPEAAPLSPPKARARKESIAAPKDRKPLAEIQEQQQLQEEIKQPRRSLRLQQLPGTSAVEAVKQYDEDSISTPPRVKARREQKLLESAAKASRKVDFPVVSGSVVEGFAVPTAPVSKSKDAAAATTAAAPQQKIQAAAPSKVEQVVAVEAKPAKGKKEKGSRTRKALTSESGEEDDDDDQDHAVAQPGKRRVTRSMVSVQQQQQQPPPPLIVVEAEKEEPSRKKKAARRSEKHNAEDAKDEAPAAMHRELEDVESSKRTKASKGVVEEQKPAGSRASKKSAVESKVEPVVTVAPVVVEEKKPAGSRVSKKAAAAAAEPVSVPAIVVAVPAVVEEKKPAGSRVSKKAAQEAKPEIVASAPVVAAPVQSLQLSGDLPSAKAGGTTRKVSGKRVAQLVSKWEVPSAAAAPNTTSAAAATTVVAAASSSSSVASAEDTTPTLSLTKEQGVDLSSRLEAIVGGAFESVASSSTTASSNAMRKKKVPVNERARAWSSKRGNTYTSFSDMLVANGIVRPDASNATIEAAVAAIPEVAGEVGDEAEKSTMSSATLKKMAEEISSSSTVPLVQRAATAVGSVQPFVSKQLPAPSVFAFSAAVAYSEDSGVSDSEDEAPVNPAPKVVPVVASTGSGSGKSGAKKVSTPTPGPIRQDRKLLTATPPPHKLLPAAIDEDEEDVDDDDEEEQEEDEAVKPLTTIQDRIAEIKKKFGASSSSAAPDAASAFPTNAPATTNAIPSVAAGLDVSLQLAAAFDPNASNSDPVLARSLHVLTGDADDSIGITNQDIAPGLFTVEITTPDRMALQQMRNEKAKPAQVVTPPPTAVAAALFAPASSVSVAQAEPATVALAPAQQVMMSFMDGSFATGDSEMYNTMDAEKAANAVQFLEQIQLNGNTSCLQDITLTGAALIGADDGNGSGNELDDDRLEEMEPKLRKRSAEEALESGSALKKLQPEQPAPVSGIPQPTLLSAKATSAVSSSSGVAGMQKQTKPTVAVAAAGKGGSFRMKSAAAAAASTASAGQATSVQAAGVNANSAPTLSKLEQARVRREKLEEEERKRREDALRKAAERELRARAVKEGKAAPVVAAAPSSVGAPSSVAPTLANTTTGSSSATSATLTTGSQQGTAAASSSAASVKAAVLEKGKKNAEKLAKSKVDEVRRKKGVVVGGPAAGATATAAPAATVQAPSAVSAAPATIASANLSSSTALVNAAVASGDKKGLLNALKIMKKPIGSSLAMGTPQTPGSATPSTPSTAVSSAKADYFSPPQAVHAKSPQQPRPSPLRKALAQQQLEGSPVRAVDVSTTQYSISPYKASDVEGDDVDPQKKRNKREAKWAKRDVLDLALKKQNIAQADDIFGFVTGVTCDLNEIFEGYKPRQKFKVRTSSANWSEGPQSKPLIGNPVVKK